mgnify:CR=1 FL=1
MDIILLGPPGAGKGTQAHVLEHHTKLVHVASGDLFRAALRQGTELGMLAKSYMDRGELVPDEVVIRMIVERISQSDCTAGVIFDGFPRTRDQAHALGVAAVDFAQQGKKRGDADREAARGCALSPGNRRCATEGHRQRGAQDAGRVHQRRRLSCHRCLLDLCAAADRRRRFAAFPQRAARSCSSEERHRAKKAGTVQHLIFL